MWVVWLALILANIISGNVSPEEKAYWEEFYNSTEGDNWINNSGWNVGDPCADTWYGLTCSGSTVVEV